MAESTNEWESSKENIQPIQQGRKAGVLKVALGPHPEDIILQQREEFEQELRTYSGPDPLDVWCRYIKWVEQNFPKGGKEGHIEQLIQKCLSIFKDEKKYFEHERFIEIWIKFANTCTQPMEIYDYMYSNNIGSKSAKFYISWAWELEQLGNFKKADEVLREGISRKAQPFEKLKSSFFEFENRFVSQVKEESEISNNQVEAGRSAFSILKPQKKNFAPVIRTGDSAIESNKILTLGGQQPQPKHNISSKKPFKIFNSENVAPILPVQSENVTPFVLYAENIKENERKPSKWNKVKVKQQIQHARPRSEGDKGFKFHCDDSPQPTSMPKIVPKTSNILSVREGPIDPPMVLFEPPDPMKKPMYDKNKVYGGAKEFCFEEIRSAAWREKKKKLEQEQKIIEQKQKIMEQENQILEQEKKILEQKNQILEQENQILKQKNQILELMKKDEELKIKIYSLTQEICRLQSNKFSVFSSSVKDSHTWGVTNNDITCKKDLDSESHISNYSTLNTNERDNIKNFKDQKLQVTKYADGDDYTCSLESRSNTQSLDIASCMVATNENIPNKNHSITEEFHGKRLSSASYREAANMVLDLYNGTLTGFTNENSNYTENGIDKKKDPGITFGNNKCPTTLSDFTSVNTNQEVKQRASLQQTTKESKVNLPFVLYHDPTETIPASSANQNISLEKNNVGIVLPKNFNIKSVSDEDLCKGDVENMPPEGYVQEINKRELAGILEPSKNIHFIPLDQQELEDDVDNEDMEQYPLYNETLVPPSNTEQFSAAICLPTSTPCTNKKNILKVSPSETEVFATPHSVFKYGPSNKISNPLTEANNSENLPKSEIKAVAKDRTLPGLPNGHLSVIMETSRECYSKSSTSSNSSASLTKFSQSDQHSINRKHLSKCDTFRDPSMLGLSRINSSDDRAQKIVQDENIWSNSKFDKPFEMFCVDHDPFDQALTSKLLKSVVQYQNCKNSFNSKKSVKSIKIGENLEIGNVTYIVERVIGEGSYAKIYEIKKLSETFDTNQSKEKFALKVCKKANEWEVYICSELHNRLLEKKCPLNIRNSVMNIISVVNFTDGIALVNDYSSLGTLLDIVNFHKKQNSPFPEYLAMYMTSQILNVVSNMHDCNIIHGDIKPDNFILMKTSDSIDSTVKVYIRLIDFGRAIDLNLFKPGICFTEKLTSKFQCNEMKDNKPWVFQLDWYGVLNCIHSMLFSEYMTVKKENNKWVIEKRFKRYWYTSLWEPLFNELLNIPSCYEKPNVKLYIDMIESKLQQNISRLNDHVLSLSRIYK